jgi:hypothetical protein
VYKFCPVRLIKVCAFLALLHGCTSRDIQPKGTGTAYFPLRVGSFWSYSVSETSITQLGGQVNTLYELKIEVIDSIPAAEGIVYVFQRTRRTNPSLPWTTIQTWSARKDAFSAVLQEGNTPFVKLSFPLTEGKTWNGNALNSLGGTEKCQNGTFACDNYEVTNLFNRFESTGIAFDDTVTVIENNEDDPIVMKDVRQSVYAKAIGLVYMEATILEYCTVGDCIGKQIVENGSIVKQTIKSYGGL